MWMKPIWQKFVMRHCCCYYCCCCCHSIIHLMPAHQTSTQVHTHMCATSSLGDCATHTGGQDNKVEHNLLLQQISTVDENGQMVVKGTKVRI